VFEILKHDKIRGRFALASPLQILGLVPRLPVIYAPVTLSVVT